MKPKHDDEPRERFPFFFFLAAGMFFAWASDFLSPYSSAFYALFGF